MPRTDLFRWAELAPMPLPRAGCAAGVLGGKLVVAGGTLWRADRKIWCDRVDSFDPGANRWESCAPLPRPLGDSACVAVGDALYALGGGAEGSTESAVWRFQSGSWTLLSDSALPAPRRSPAAAVLDGTVYVLGGYESADLASAASTLWAWRPGGRWEARAARPGPVRFSPAVAPVGGRIIAAGGATVENGGVRNLDDILAYDPAADSWSAIGRLPEPNRAACGLADEGRFLFIGGYTDKFERPILAIDPGTGTAAPAGSLPHGLADTRFLRMGARIIGATGECGNKVRAPWTLAAG